MGNTRDTGFLRNIIAYDASGNVGIGGAANASYKLAVTGDIAAAGGAYYLQRATSSTILPVVRYWNGTGSPMNGGALGDILTIGTQGSNEFTIATDNTRRLTILSNGNIGIGTSTPSALLTLIGGEVRWGFTSDMGALSYTGGNPMIQALGALNMIFATNGSERMRITSAGNTEVRSGNVLNIYRSDNTRALQFYTDNNACYIDSWEASSEPLRLRSNGSGGRLEFHTNGSERMRINSSGYVGIGTTNPSSRLTIIRDSPFNTGDQALRIRATDGDGYNLWMGASTNGYATIQAYQDNVGGATLCLNPLNGGNVLIGTLSNVGQKLRIYQASTAQWNIKLIQPDGSNQLFQEFLTTTDGDASNTARGSIRYNGTNVLYLGTSDYRLKDDLKDYNGLDIISQIKTYNFKWKEAGTRDYGVMAHELQELLPNYVTGAKDDINEDGSINPQQVDYSKLVPVLIKAIQEQQENIKSQEQRIAYLENK